MSSNSSARIIHMPVGRIRDRVPLRDQMDEHQREMFNHMISVSNRGLLHREYLQQLLRICSKSPRALLLRDDNMTEEEYNNVALEAAFICGAADVKLVLHDHVEIARGLGLRSIHLSYNQLERMTECGRDPYEYFDEIGCSVLTRFEAKSAEKMGAGYVTVGEPSSEEMLWGKSMKERCEEISEIVSIPVLAEEDVLPNLQQIREMFGAESSGCIFSAMMQV
ncbi:MAG: thiamine phosphate synthase [Bilifractor sp.]|jgi:thiamine-phosphate pyrophosphorylase